MYKKKKKKRGMSHQDVALRCECVVKASNVMFAHINRSLYGFYKIVSLSLDLDACGEQKNIYSF